MVLENLSFDDEKSKINDYTRRGKKSAFEKKKNLDTSLSKKTDLYNIKSFNNVNLLQKFNLVDKKHQIYRCSICDEEFNKYTEFKSHVSFHGPEDRVVCKGCTKVFRTLKLYQNHAKQNPGLHNFVCKLCLRQFPTELMLEQHVCICQNGKPLYCACGKEFTKYKDVVTHSKGTKPFYCCSCSHAAASLTAHLRHLRRHSKQKPFQCNKCDMKFAVIDFLNIHFKKCHNSESILESENISVIEPKSENLDCILCKKVFEAREDLKKHMSTHEQIQCPDCGKLLKRNRLESHRNTHKTSASLCPECGKLYETRFKLTQHIITTHNSEPVKCEVCMKVLKTKKILNEHMKTHLKSEVGGRVPQAICPMCGLGLAQKGSLARHILLTHEKHKIIPCNKTYICQECSEVLPNRGKYYSHRRMHRAMIDRFPCEVCGREFNKKQNLRRHMYLLHDEKRILSDPIFKCQICTKCFREKKNLKRHYKMVHKLEDIV